MPLGSEHSFAAAPAFSCPVSGTFPLPEVCPKQAVSGNRNLCVDCGQLEKGDFLRFCGVFPV